MTPRLTAFGDGVEIESEIDMIIQFLSVAHRDYITIDELLELRHTKVKWKERRDKKWN